MGGSTLSAEQASILINRNSPTLQEIIFNSFTYEAGITLLQPMPNVKSLVLDSCSDYFVNQFASKVSALEKITVNVEEFDSNMETLSLLINNNLTSIIYLDLKVHHSQGFHIQEPLPNLQTLSLTNCCEEVNDAVVANVSNLEEISLSGSTIHISNLTTLMKNSSNTLKNLSLTKLRKWYMTHFFPLPHLKKLCIIDCKPLTVKAFLESSSASLSYLKLCSVDLNKSIATPLPQLRKVRIDDERKDISNCGLLTSGGNISQLANFDLEYSDYESDDED